MCVYLYIYIALWWMQTIENTFSGDGMLYEMEEEEEFPPPPRFFSSSIPHMIGGSSSSVMLTPMEVDDTTRVNNLPPPNDQKRKEHSFSPSPTSSSSSSCSIIIIGKEPNNTFLKRGLSLQGEKEFTCSSSFFSSSLSDPDLSPKEDSRRKEEKNEKKKQKAQRPPPSPQPQPQQEKEKQATLALVEEEEEDEDWLYLQVRKSMAPGSPPTLPTWRTSHCCLPPSRPHSCLTQAAEKEGMYAPEEDVHGHRHRYCYHRPAFTGESFLTPPPSSSPSPSSPFQRREEEVGGGGEGEIGEVREGTESRGGDGLLFLFSRPPFCSPCCDVPPKPQPPMPQGMGAPRSMSLKEDEKDPKWKAKEEIDNVRSSSPFLLDLFPPLSFPSTACSPLLIFPASDPVDPFLHYGTPALEETKTSEGVSRYHWKRSREKEEKEVKDYPSTPCLSPPLRPANTFSTIAASSSITPSPPPPPLPPSLLRMDLGSRETTPKIYPSLPPSPSLSPPTTTTSSVLCIPPSTQKSEKKERRRNNLLRGW